MNIFDYLQESETECSECGCLIKFCKECKRNHHVDTFEIEHIDEQRMSEESK